MAKIGHRWLAGTPIFAIFLLLGQIGFRNSTWSHPETIPGYDLDTWPPILVPDQNRTVHAFSSQWIGVDDENRTRVIMYNSWTYDQGWTLPVNILLSPNKEARMLDAFLDSEGFFHLIFWGGDNTSADIYYTKALASRASDPRSWQIPVVAASRAGDPDSGVLLWDEHENLGIVYHGKSIGEGIYVSYTEDGGDTWADPIPIYFSGAGDLIPSGLKAFRSDSGKSHLVWNMVTFGGQGREIYYSNIDIGKTEWREPFLIDGVEEGLGTFYPVAIEHKEILYVIFTNGLIKMRSSTDGGETWSNIATLFARHRGYNGALSPVIDGDGNLNLFFGQRIGGSPDIHGMWHSLFVNNHWTEPDSLIKGPQLPKNGGADAFDPFEAHAVAVQGNVIMVTWRRDPGIAGNGVWYSYKRFDTEELPVSPLPKFEQAEVISDKTITSSPDALDNMDPNMNTLTSLPPSGDGLGSNAIILIGGLSTLILVILIVLRRLISIH